MLLDEPTSALDPWGRQRLRVLVRERQAAGASILIASHNLSEIDRLCDELAVIAEGRIIARGPIGALMPAGLTVRFDLRAGGVPTDVVGRVAGVASVEVDAAQASFVITVKDRLAVDRVISGVLAVLAGEGAEVRRIVRGPELEQVLTELVSFRKSVLADPNTDPRGAEER